MEALAARARGPRPSEAVAATLGTDLLAALWGSDTARALRLLSEGAALHVADKATGLTALHMACYKALPEAALAIVCAPDVNANQRWDTVKGAPGSLGNRGSTAILAASSAGLEHVVAVLLAKGADKDATTSNWLFHNLTPLYVACANSRETVALQLIRAGANVNKGSKLPLYLFRKHEIYEPRSVDSEDVDVRPRRFYSAAVSMPAVEAALVAAGAKEERPGFCCLC